jgi:capsular polysaccharide biosynthesis protein
VLQFQIKILFVLRKNYLLISLGGIQTAVKKTWVDMPGVYTDTQCLKMQRKRRKMKGKYFKNVEKSTQDVNNFKKCLKTTQNVKKLKMFKNNSKYKQTFKNV